MLHLSSERLAIALLFIAIAVLAACAPAQSDTWWLLRAGQDIWRTGSVPLHDTYSYTAAGQPWPNHEWLTEILFYGLYTVGGLPFLAALCASAIVTTWALSWRLGRGAFEVQFVLFAASLGSCAPAWALRPQVFSMLAFAATCALLLSDRLLWLPLLFLVWVNMHGAVALGLVAVAAAAAADLATTGRIPRRILAIGAACAAVTLVSPLGLSLWTFIPESMRRSHANELIEWQAPGRQPMFWVFWIVALLLPLAALRRWRVVDLRTRRLAAIGLATLPLAASGMRNVPVFLLAAVPAVSTLLSLAGSAADRPGARHERVGVNGAIALAGALIATLIVGTVWTVRPPFLGWQPIAPETVAAVSECQGPLYNTYDEGGALIWFAPANPVFIDSRQDPYPAALLARSHRLELDGMYDELFEQYGIRCAVVPAGSLTGQRLSGDRRWRPVSADRPHLVFYRQQTTPENTAASALPAGPPGAASRLARQ
jgi:hypothetical protein